MTRFRRRFKGWAQTSASHPKRSIWTRFTIRNIPCRVASETVLFKGIAVFERLDIVHLGVAGGLWAQTHRVQPLTPVGLLSLKRYWDGRLGPLCSILQGYLAHEKSPNP